MRWIFFVVVTIVSGLALAEYRAFLLKISKPAAEAGKEPAFRLVKSNLDPNQYPTYYPVYPDESITYVDTWMCRGRTSGIQPICPSPREPANAPPNQNP